MVSLWYLTFFSCGSMVVAYVAVENVADVVLYFYCCVVDNVANVGGVVLLW